MNYRGNWDPWTVAAGACVGAGLMYLLDPQGGGRRRALVRDKMAWASRKTRDGAAATARDLRHRVTGLAAEVQSRFSDQSADDAVLVERVRAELGRITSHPSSIEVTASDGHVILGGPILASELNRVLRGIRRVRGVEGVESRLTPHAQPGDVPGLQGGMSRPGRRWPWMQGSWSPTARLIAATAGAALTVGGVRQRSAYGIAMAAAGVGLFARGVTDTGPGRLVDKAKEWRESRREEIPVGEWAAPPPSTGRKASGDIGGVVH